MGPLLLGAAALLVFALPAAAADEARIAIIIDDVGDRLDYGRRAVELPGAVTTSFLPHTPYAATLAREAHAWGKEVMLHLPMETLQARPLGPGALTQAMARDQFLTTLRGDIAAVPYVGGINNHMGSRMTADATRMGWLMAELRAYEGLFFVDSRTTAATVAGATAGRHGVPNSRRDFFLDNEPHPGAIWRQFDRFIAAARRNGSAIAIAHAQPATLAVLESRLPRLEAEGVRLVPVSQIISHQQEQRVRLWQASLSPSPPEPKSSK